MKTKFFFLFTAMFFLFIPLSFLGQVKVTFDYVENQELMDFFRFEKIEYLKLSFSDKDLRNKTYQLSVKEIWDGEITKERPIVNSKTMPFEQLKTVGDTIFNVRIISKLTNDNKLRMDFHFPSFSTQTSFDATSSNIYSLRSVKGEGAFEYEKNNYILVYILPYEKDNAQYYCAVESSGYELEAWGKEFGIKHYLVFEMKFESL